MGAQDPDFCLSCFDGHLLRASAERSTRTDTLTCVTHAIHRTVCVRSSLLRQLTALDVLGGLEGMACDVPLDPGDVLFFREDLFHRTQDVLHDRLALILDVWRTPLASGVRYRPEMRW